MGLLSDVVHAPGVTVPSAYVGPGPGEIKGGLQITDANGARGAKQRRKRSAPVEPAPSVVDDSDSSSEPIEIHVHING